MRVILSAQDQKDLHYEVECILRMFLPQLRLDFAQAEAEPSSEQVVIVTGEGENTVTLSVPGFSGEEREPASASRKDTEASVCRCLYRLLVRATWKKISWGVLTGIRPVKLVRELREQEPRPYTEKPGAADPRRLVEALSEKMEPDAVYVADVGQNQLWSARYYRARGGRFLTSGGMGTMGYALPAAVGAKLAAPNRQVVAVCGDGSFQMSMMELGTAVQHGVDVKLVVVRNNRLGLVREIQQNRYGGREIAVDLSGSPSACGIAAAYGIPAWQVSDNGSLGQAVERLLRTDGPALIECLVDPKEATE